MKQISKYKLNFNSDFIIEYQKGVKSILKSNALSESDFVKKFELNFSKFVKSKYAIAVNSGTSALEIAFRTVNPKGKKIIIPSNTFFGTATAVSRSNSAIELCDIENETFSICPRDLEKKIYKNVGAVCIVHVGGLISKNTKEIKKICKKHNVPLIEDAAHAHGSYYEKYQAGTIGDIACFSFYPTKVMTTGEGGMITTNNKKFYNIMCSLKNFGRNLRDIRLQKLDGNNHKMSEFQGLMGYLELKRIKQRINKRNSVARYFMKKFNKSELFQFVSQKKGLCSHYKLIVKTTINNSKLREYFYKNKISLAGEVYKFPIHTQPLFNKKFKFLNYPMTNHFSNFHICPPLYPELTLEEIYHIEKIFHKAINDLQ